MPKYLVEHRPEFSCFNVVYNYWLRPNKHIKGFYYGNGASANDMEEVKQKAKQFIAVLEKFDASTN